jgi:hypothetical protein
MDTCSILSPEQSQFPACGTCLAPSWMLRKSHLMPTPFVSQQMWRKARFILMLDIAQMTYCCWQIKEWSPAPLSCPGPGPSLWLMWPYQPNWSLGRGWRGSVRWGGGRLIVTPCSCLLPLGWTAAPTSQQRGLGWVVLKPGWQVDSCIWYILDS